MADTNGTSNPLRALFAAVSVVALGLGLLPLAPGAQATPPNQRSGDNGTAATGGEAETAQNADSPIEFQRQAGATRYQTAAEIATARFDASTDVVIATGEEFADALAGAGLEGTLEAPVLLVPSSLVNGSIPSAITDAIDELGATSATLLGGENAISTGVEDHIEDNSTVTTTDRVSGTTRFETAEEIANRVSASPLPTALSDELGFDGGDTAFLATGLEFADALAAGPGAYEGPRPTLLTGPDELHPAAERGLNASGAENVIILGGNAAVSSSVESELQSEGFETARLAGADRWETATEVADAFADGLGFGVADVGLATGFKFADALASAPYLGEVPAPVVLTPSNAVNDQPLSWFEARGCDIETIHVFGGQVAVEDSVAEGYAEAACPPEPEPESMTLDVQPETQTVGETATATASVSDADGDPVEGTTVDFTTQHSEGGAVVPEDGSDDTDASGEATFEFTTAETGTVTVTGTTDGVQAQDDTTFVDPFRIEDADGEPETGTVGVSYTEALMSEANRAEPISPDQFFLLEGSNADALDPEDPNTFAQQAETVTITDASAGDLQVEFADDLVAETEYTLAYAEDEANADVRVKNPDGEDALSPDEATFNTSSDPLLSGESVEDLEADNSAQQQGFAFTVGNEPIGFGDVVTIDVSGADAENADYSGASVASVDGQGTAELVDTTITYAGGLADDAVGDEVTITLQDVGAGSAQAGLEAAFGREDYSNTVTFDITG